MNKFSSLARTLLPFVAASGCTSNNTAPPSDTSDDFTGISEAAEGLTDLSGECTFATGTLTVALATGDVAMVSRSPGSDASMLINGFACGGATSTTMKKLVVTGTAGAQTLIIDYSGGMFGLGTTTGTGIDVDMAGGTDAVKFRGTKAADTWVFGSTGIAVNADTYKDVTVANAETFVVSMTDGDDSFSGQGNATTGGAAFATAITVYGGAGKDTLKGGSGADTLDGGDGDDVFVAAAADGDDVLVGGAGADTADYATRTVALTLANDGTATSGATGEADTIGADIETMKGGTGNDIITGGAGNDTIYGGAGDDTITGGLGNDTLYGDAGNDTFLEGAATSGADIFNGGAGTDTVSYTARTNNVVALIDGVAHSGETSETDKLMADIENITGGGGDDTITGSAVDNVLDGGAGNDTLNGLAGNDTLHGGAGNDTMNGGDGSDRFDEDTAASGNDTMNGGLGTDTVDYSGRTNDLTVTMLPSAVSGESGESDVIGADIENCKGGAGDDTITGNPLDNQIEGGAGVDTIFGMAGDDLIDGQAGADVIDCGSGDADILLDATVASSVSCEL
ncbi:calcium-binding protein [soil metagenome]